MYFFITVKSVRMLLKTTYIPRILYCIILMLCVTMMVFTSICVDDTVCGLYISIFHLFCEAAFDELEFIMCLSLKHLCFYGYQYAIKVQTNFSNVVY